MSQTLEIVKRVGYVTVISIFPEEFTLSITDVVRKEVNLKGANDAIPGNLERAIDLMTNDSIDTNPDSHCTTLRRPSASRDLGRGKDGSQP